jgi:hypothetical protein
MRSEAEAAILKLKKAELPVDLVTAFLEASRLPGQSTPRLVRRIVESSFNAQSMPLDEFFRYGMHRPQLTDAECRAYLSRSAVNRFNSMLNGPPEASETVTLRNKLKSAAILKAAGVPVARVRAIYPGNPDHLGARILHSAADIADFLTDKDNMPCFGKPVYDAFARGIIAIDGPVGDGRLQLMDGRVVRADRLADEIVATYGQGYMFQDMLRASASIRHLSGPVLPILRVYSIWIANDARPVYAVLRMPAVGEISDDTKLKGSVRLHLDLATGRVLRAQDMGEFAGADANTAPATGVPFAGQRLADWDAMMDIAVAVHRQFPRQRSIGIDIAPSDQGVIVNEANAGAFHVTYQAVSLEGLLNPRFNVLFREALAERGIRKPPPGVPWPRG